MIIANRFSDSWPKAGMMSDGVAYRRPKWELRIKEIEFGLWATPCAGDYWNSNGGGQTRSLRKDIYEWKKGIGTPTTKMGNRSERFKRKVLTPVEFVKMYPTPSARDYKGAGKNAALRDSLDYAIERGMTRKELFTPPQSDGQLNSDWVEWLMCWPIGLTSPEPMPREKYDKWVEAINSGTWWDNEPDDVPRVAKGQKNRVQRLIAIGNGQVPPVVVAAWRLLMGGEI